MTRFEEIICSSETARVFMSVCDVGRTGFVAWLYDWQTLIAGGIASVSVFFLVRQTRIQEATLLKQIKKDDRDAEQKRKAVLIQVPSALAAVGDYLAECFEAWEKEEPTKRPRPPKDAIQIIMNASPYVDDESFESFRQLIVTSQTFESRLKTIKSERPLNQQNVMLADIATYSYKTTRLFNYARLEQNTSSIPYKKPTRDDLENELNRFVRFRNGNSDPVFGRIEVALDEDVVAEKPLVMKMKNEIAFINI